MSAVLRQEGGGVGVSPSGTLLSLTANPQEDNKSQSIPFALVAATSPSTSTCATPTKSKRATSFIRKKKPPLERGLSAQSALRVNKNAFVCKCRKEFVEFCKEWFCFHNLTLCFSPELPADGPAPDVSITVTKPSPEAPLLDTKLVHVLVHRESEEYNTSDVEDAGTPSGRPRPPEIKISPGSDDQYPIGDGALIPESIVKIMVESPKDPPQVDYHFAAADIIAAAVDVDAEDDLAGIRIDVNNPVDTTNIFYEYEEQPKAGETRSEKKEDDDAEKQS